MWGKADALKEYICPAFGGASAFQVFFSSLSIAVIFLSASFLAGLSALGQPLAIALLMGIGADLGFFAAAIYSDKGASAITAILILYLPKAAALSIIAVTAAREALRCSSALLSGAAFSGSLPEESPILKLYCVKFIVLAIAGVITAVADSVLNYFFGDLLSHM